MSIPILSLRGLRTTFATPLGSFSAIDGIDLDLFEGETLCLVGESGCGKSVTALSILRLLPEPPARIEAGEVRYRGTDLLRLPLEEMRHLRGNRIAMIFQEPMTSLNPVFTVGNQIEEVLQVHTEQSRSERRERVTELLELVGIPSPAERAGDYPHQLSGGMRQRVMIAMALSCDPKLLLADEPTTALDVTIQAQVLEVMARLSRELGTAVIVITHNLGVVARYADRVNVMYGGRIVEMGPATAIYHEPQHAYTLGLLESVPRLDVREGRLIPIEGSPPDLTNLPPGCSFAPRCRFATDQCRNERPELVEVAPDHRAACWHHDEVFAEARAKVLSAAGTEG